MDRRFSLIVLVIICFFGCNLFGQKVEITSDNFVADEILLVSEFSGNVHIKKGLDDELMADKVIVNFNKERLPIKYTATGNSRFKTYMKEKKYSGSGNKLVYEPLKKVYTLIGNAHLKEIGSDKNVYGQKIIVDRINGTYKVSSDEKKPVKFIFQIEEKK